MFIMDGAKIHFILKYLNLLNLLLESIEEAKEFGAINESSVNIGLKFGLLCAYDNTLR